VGPAPSPLTPLPTGPRGTGIRLERAKHARTPELRLLDHESEKGPPRRIPDEGSVKEGGGLVVLEQQEQRQAEPRERDNVGGICDQAISAMEQEVANVVPHLAFELPDELAGGQRSIEDERGSVVGLALRVPSLIPVPRTGNTVEAIKVHDAIMHSLTSGPWTLEATHVPTGVSALAVPLVTGRAHFLARAGADWIPGCALLTCRARSSRRSSSRPRWRAET
jgi:hypothetical protein